MQGLGEHGTPGPQWQWKLLHTTVPGRAVITVVVVVAEVAAVAAVSTSRRRGGCCCRNDICRRLQVWMDP